MVREGLTKRMPSEQRLEEGANHPAVREGCCRQSKSLGLVDGVVGGRGGQGVVWWWKLAWSKEELRDRGWTGGCEGRGGA